MDLTTFDFNSAPVRVLVREEQPWFVAVDVCRVLEIANSRDAVSGLDEDEKAVATADTLGGKQQAQIVSESGLYALIFKSRKPEAKKFRKWVTGVVLPSLRQTGRFAVPAADTGAKLSVLSYVRERCAIWTLERQMNFGQTVRQFSRAMGVCPQTDEEPGVGRVLVFSRSLLEQVCSSFARTSLLPDSDTADFERLLEAVVETHGPGEVKMKPAVLCAIAKGMGLFAQVFTPSSTLPAEHSAFGKICRKNDGHRLPRGHVLRVRGSLGSPSYHIMRHELMAALT